MAEVDRSLIKDNEGVKLGSAKSFVNKFKRMEPGIPKDPNDTEEEEEQSSQPATIQEPVALSYSLPADYTPEAEKDILTHYYRKFGDQSCNDFEKASGRIAAALNRLYKKNFTPADLLKKLFENVTIGDLKIKETIEKEIRKVPIAKYSKVKISLNPGKYDFVEGLEPLTDEQKDLCQFIDRGSLCFSSDGYSVFLSVKPEKKKCFDNLFKFNDREKIVFEMFREQLGDEHKARKLVLMSRKLTNPPPKKKRPAHKKDPTEFTTTDLLPA